MLVILIIAVIGVGAYFIIKDATKDNSQNSQTTSTTTQTNGAISGTCEISLIPSAGGTTYSDTNELDVQNKVSTCDENFDLKKLSSDTYTVRIIINAHDGRTTTLEKSVNI